MQVQEEEVEIWRIKPIVNKSYSKRSSWEGSNEDDISRSLVAEREVKWGWILSQVFIKRECCNMQFLVVLILCYNLGDC